ncbi:MAG: alpha/beta hydrolase [Anaerolineae bacterium]
MVVNERWAELSKTEIPLYEGVAAGSEGWTQAMYPSPETDGYLDGGLHVVRNVVRPTLTPFFPAERPPFGSAVLSATVPSATVPSAVGDTPTAPLPTGATAVVIAPGGAWHFLAWDHEGIQVAEWLQARGIAAFILKYRLLPTGDTFPRDYEGRMAAAGPNFMQWLAPHLPLISADAQNAIRLVRSRAAEWGIDPGKIGIMGFSAGGTVTSLATLQYDPSSRPDFAAPIYGAGAPGEVPADAPPLFVACAQDDGLMPHSLEMFNRWRAAGREAELHLYARGGHGFGMNKTGLPAEGWIERFYEWLGMLGMV